MAENNDLLLQSLLPESELNKSAKAIKGQMESGDDLTKGYQAATNVLTDFQNEMEALATEKLPEYANTLKEATTAAADAMILAIQFLRHEISLSDIEDLISSRAGGAGGTYVPPVGAKPTDQSGLPGDKRTVAEKQADDKAVRKGKKSYNALGFDQPNVDPYEVAAAKAKEKKLEEMNREELKVRDAALKSEMLQIVTEKEYTDADRAAHKARIDIINRDTARIDQIQRQKGWLEPDKVAPKPNPKPGKAKGGISTGPMSGYQETLHGTEAVVPLPDNKSIPVTLDSSSLNKQMAHQTSILNEILVAMRDGNKYASGLLRNSY
jgi:hypothetical protein